MSIRMHSTKGHTGNRRSHHALKNIRLGHRLDEATGMYRGKQIFAPKAKKAVVEKKVKGASTEPVAQAVHDHTHDHANSEVKGLKGMFGKLGKGGRPKARSGFGGGA